MKRHKHITEVLDYLDKDMIRVTAEDALYVLTTAGMAHFPEDKARRILNIAWEFENKAEPCPGGYVHVYYFGRPGNREDALSDKPLWSVVEHFGPRVAIPRGRAYTERTTPSRSGKAASPTTKGNTMPPRKRPAPEPEVVEENGSRSKLDNLEKYMTKDFTPVMDDYITWFTENVADPTEVDAERLIFLAVNFYSEFQSSDYNRERRAARRAERAAPEQTPEPEPAKPARGRGRPSAAKPAAGKPAPAKAGRKPRAAATSGAAVY